MKKFLLFTKSLMPLLLICATVVVNAQNEVAVKNKNKKSKATAHQNPVKVIHSPGTPHPAKLDSLKAEKMKQKMQSQKN